MANLARKITRMHWHNGKVDRCIQGVSWLLSQITTGKKTSHYSYPAMKKLTRKLSITAAVLTNHA